MQWPLGSSVLRRSGAICPCGTCEDCGELSLRSENDFGERLEVLPVDYERSGEKVVGGNAQEGKPRGGDGGLDAREEKRLCRGEKES